MVVVGGGGGGGVVRKAQPFTNVTLTETSIFTFTRVLFGRNRFQVEQSDHS